MARKKTITKRRRGLFLDKLRATGNVSEASIAGEIGRGSWYDKRLVDKEFAAEWDDAEMTFLDRFEATAIKRSVVGEIERKPYLHVNKDGSKQTKMRDVITKSDRLMALTLTARHPSYRPVTRVEQTSPDGSMTPAKVTTMPNLDALEPKEVQTLTHLLRKAHAAAGT
jgi:hypothetical protein